MLALRGNVCEIDGEGPRYFGGKIIDRLDIDHILARKDGGTDDPANLRVLHHSEHARKTAKVDGRWGRR